MASEVCAGKADEGYSVSSPYDSRGLWGWPNCGAGIYTHHDTPNSSDPDMMWPGECAISMPEANLPCTTGSTSEDTMYAAARSRHPGGVNAVFIDGHVSFIPDTVSSNIWKCLGAIADESVISTSF